MVKKYKKVILKQYIKNGEVLRHSQFMIQIEVDEKQFEKQYLSNFSAFFDIKPQAIKVFEYIITQLISNKDEFIFFIEDCIEYTGYKSDTSIKIGFN